MQEQCKTTQSSVDIVEVRVSPVEVVLDINGELLDELNGRVLELARRVNNISAKEVAENEGATQAMPSHGSSPVVSQIELQREMIGRTLGNVNRIISKLEV